MNILVSFWYLGLVVVAAGAYRIAAPCLGPTMRAWMLAAISVGFLWKFLGLPAFWGWLAGWLLLMAAAASGLRRCPPPRRPLLLLLAIAGIVAVGLVFHYPNTAAALFGDHPPLRSLADIAWVGLSYSSFRAIDLLMQARSERTKTFRLPTAIAYLLYFPPFIAGPINRFAPFAKDLEDGPSPLTRTEWRDIVFRFSLGIFKLIVLSRVAWYWSLPAMPDDGVGLARPDLILGLYAYLAYIYFEFAGYSDLVIVVSRLIGVRMPENFHFPLLAPNIQEFWNRWHMSLSLWCRDHIFYPCTRHLAMKIGPLAGATIGIVITFLVIGLWHGDALNWVLYGLYHGIGLAIWMVWRAAGRRFAPSLQERADKSMSARIAAIAITINYFAFGLILTLPMDKALKIISTAVCY